MTLKANDICWFEERQFLTWCRRATACALALLAMATAGSSAADAPDDGAPQVHWSLEWRAIKASHATCKAPSNSSAKGIFALHKRVGGVDIIQYIFRKTGEIAGFCVRELNASQIIFQGNGRDDWNVVVDGPGRQVVVHRVDSGYSAILDMDGALYTTPLRRGPGRPHLKAAWNGAAATLIVDWSDTGGGLDTYPLTPSVATSATHWIQAEFYGQVNDAFYAWDICGHRSLAVSSTSTRGEANTVRCQSLDHDGWHEFVLRSERPAHSALFIHGGPAGSFRLNERSSLLALAASGYEVRVVNYSDRDPPPTGSLALAQGQHAERQIEKAWLSEYKASGARPTVLVESFGFQMLARLLRRSEPLTIWAVSPVLSAPRWLQWQKEKGADEGIPWANWRHNADIVRARPDVLSLLCRRKAPTKLIIVSSVADTTIEPGSSKSASALRMCPNIQLEYRESQGAEHATDDLYLSLFRQEVNPDIGPASISINSRD